MDIPFAVDISHHTTKSYIDTIGRRVVLLRLSNTQAVHQTVVKVGYDFSPLWLLHEPLLIAAGGLGPRAGWRWGGLGSGIEWGG